MAVPTVRGLVSLLGSHLAPAEGFVASEAPISAVHISELADPTAYLEGDELLLTTGLGLPLDRPGLEAYVARLVAIGVAALGFGVGPVHAEVPPGLAPACRAAGLPLLVIPEPTPFLTISRAYWTSVARSGESELQSQLGAQRALLDAALADEPTTALLESLSTWVGGWAALLSRHGSVEQVWPESAAESAVALAADVRRMEARHTRGAFSIRSDDLHVLILPVPAVADTAERAYVAVGASQRIPATLRRTLLTSAGLLGLVGRVRARVDDAPEPPASAIASLLCAGHLEAARHLARESGSRIPAGRVRLGVVQSRRPGAIATVLRRTGAVLAWMRLENAAFLVVANPEILDTDGFFVALRGADPRSASFVSRAMPIERVPGARLAVEAELPTLRAGSHRGEVDPDPVDYALLERLADRPELRAALAAYLRFRGRWEDAARHLDVHRNTLRYRIGRVRELLAVDLDDPDVSARLWLALSD